MSGSISHVLRVDNRGESRQRFRPKSRPSEKFGVNRISLGMQSWDDHLLKLLGREHNARQAEESFDLMRAAGFTNINVDLMFGLPGQTIEQWRSTLEKTIALQPDHISATASLTRRTPEFFLRHARGEFQQDADADSEFFEIADGDPRARRLRTLRNLELCASRVFVSSQPRLLARQRLSGHRPKRGFDCRYAALAECPADYRSYIDRVLSGQSPVASIEDLTSEMKRTERIALSLRTRDGVSASGAETFRATNQRIYCARATSRIRR